MRLRSSKAAPRILRQVAHSDSGSPHPHRCARSSAVAADLSSPKKKNPSSRPSSAPSRVLPEWPRPAIKMTLGIV